jgi:hypothetical protein
MSSEGLDPARSHRKLTLLSFKQGSRRPEGYDNQTVTLRLQRDSSCSETTAPGAIIVIRSIDLRARNDGESKLDDPAATTLHNTVTSCHESHP